MNMRPERYRTVFGKFIRQFTVQRLVRVMASHGDPITDRSVYGWISGRTVPRPRRALLLVAISDGRLQMSDIYRHGTECCGHGRERKAGLAAPAENGTGRD